MRECAFKGWLPLAMAPQQCVRTCAQLILSWVRAILFPFYCFSLDLLQVPKVVSHLHNHKSSVLLPLHQSSNPWNHSLHQPMSPPPPTLSLIFSFKQRQGNPNAAYHLTILCISGLFFLCMNAAGTWLTRKLITKLMIHMLSPWFSSRKLNRIVRIKRMLHHGTAGSGSLKQINDLIKKLMSGTKHRVQTTVEYKFTGWNGLCHAKVCGIVWFRWNNRKTLSKFSN